MSRRTIQRGDVARLEIANGLSALPTIVEIDHAGVSFRLKGHRFRVSAPWRQVNALAERLTGELAHREQLRDRAIARARRRA